MESKIQDAIHLEALANHLGILTQSGKNALKEKTGTWVSDLNRLKQRSSEFAILQRIAEEGGEGGEDFAVAARCVAPHFLHDALCSVPR